MAFVCVLDVVIHFISFRNIDLASQGTYAIKKSSTGVLVALPISCTSDHNIKHILSAEYEEQNPPGIEVRNFSPKISLDDTSAVTRSFNICFKEEEAEIGDTANFKLEFDPQMPEVYKTPLIFLIEVVQVKVEVNQSKIKNKDSAAAEPNVISSRLMNLKLLLKEKILSTTNFS
eukprot:GHVP01016431.1.p1 GENE.GHVP01016431.1~~GHVP01016431.1.p1  ORF type:complete len:174 (+),score=26.97 GHVP01016431.1:65-586(+)